MSGIALTICIFFVAAVLRIESKQTKTTSAGLWVTLIWLLIAASRNVTAWHILPDVGAPDIDYTSGSPIDRVIDSCLIGLGLLILIRRRLPWYEIMRGNTWLIALFIYMGVSILWSDFAQVSFKRWIRSIGVIMFSLVVLTENNPLEAVKRLLRRCMIILIPLSILLIVYFPRWGISEDSADNGTWIGVTTQKNELGQLACASAVFFLWNIINTWKKKNPMLIADMLMFLMSLWLLKGSEVSSSKTSQLLFIIGAVIVTGLHLFNPGPRKIGYVTLAVLILLPAAHMISYEVFDTPFLNMIVESSGRDMTLTGRTDLWQDVIDAASKSPIFGKGYGSFWIGDLANDLWDTYVWKPQASDCGYIDVYVELGIMGLALLCVLLVSTYRKILRELREKKEFGQFQLAFFAMSVVYNITETAFLRPVGILWIILVLVSLTVPERQGI